MSDARRLGRRVFTVTTIRYPGMWPRVHWWYCGPSGGPVPKHEAGWRHISGFYIRIGLRLWSVQWRRFWRD